jgi:hypothetical protein
MARRPTRFLPVLGAVVCSAAALNAGLVGAGIADPGTPDPPADPQSVSKLLNYDCAFGDSADKHQVTVAITTTAPSWVRAGKPVRLGALATEVTLADETRQALVTLGPMASVAGQGKFDITARQGKRETALPVSLTWPGAPLPESGPVGLTGSATAPPAPAAEAGELEFAVAAPAITLNPLQADGTPATPPSAALTCTASEGQDPVLAKVSVLAPGAQPPPSTGVDPSQPGGVTDPNSPQSTNGLAAAARSVTYFSAQAVTGTSTVTKIGTDITIGPGMSPTVSVVFAGVGLASPLTADTALPKSRSPFYAFGFMPTTGTAEFLPPGNPDGKITSLTGSLKTGVLETMHTEAIIRLSGVKVNGVPLDVGPDCRTESPVSITMASAPGGTWTATGGGPVGTNPNSPNPDLRGFTIPPFTGCGVDEPLNPLVTGLVSGPDNQINLLLKPITANPPAN